MNAHLLRSIVLYCSLSVALAACSGGSDDLDRLIASEPSLERLDRQLEWTLAAAGGGEALGGEQTRWRERLTACLDKEDPARCVAEAHRERLANLQARFELTPRGVAAHAAGEMGFEFLGRGNEPGWNLMASDERGVWETNYGQERYEVEWSSFEQDGDARIYLGSLNGEDFRVRIDAGPCADDMSGESFDWNVEIRHGATRLRGCADRTRD